MYVYNYTIQPRKQLSAAKVAILQYLQRRDSLPDPKGSLLSAIPAQTIARVNQEMQAAAAKDTKVREKRKRSAYNRYSPTDCADIGRYVSQHGVDVTIHVKAANTRDPFCNPPIT